MLHHGHRHLGGFGGDLGADALPSMERSKAINCSKKGMPRVSSMLFDLEVCFFVPHFVFQWSKQAML